jgi:hypothetical protein
MAANTLTQPPIHGHPRDRRATRLGMRALAAVVFAACAGILGLSAYLTPSPAGVGTHEQLGLPPCGFLLATGLPCPTCGYTTAFALAAHGRLWAAWRTQPAGAALVVMVAMLTLVSAYSLGTGVSLAWLGRVARAWVLVAMGILVIGAWVYKILMIQQKL